MPLQTDRLVMISLGILNDAPPVDIQPRLPDGIHLRWAFQRDASFPWYGYYLFRRPHERKPLFCTAKNFVSQPVGAFSASTWAVEGGGFHSDVDLVMTEDTGVPGIIGLDLAERSYLQFDTPVGDPAFRVDLTIGFREAAQKEQCIDLVGRDIARIGDHFVIDGVEFDIRGGQNPNSIPTPGGSITVTATLAKPVNRVSVDLTAAANAAPVLEALDNNNRVITSVDTAPSAGRPSTFHLSARRPFRRFRIRAPQGQMVLHRLCYVPQLRTGRGVVVTAFDGDMPVASQMLRYTAGQTSGASLWFDRITSVRITPGDGALIELCYLPVSADANKDWQPVPGCPQPMTLPLTHPDYPAHPGSVDLNAAWSDAQSRIVYGSSVDWAGDPFTSLHTQLEALVAGGPPGPLERAMDHPARAYTRLTGTETPIISGDRPPSIPQLHPLDLVVLGSIHPAVAQMTGLYWADSTIHPAGAYDYLVVADHDGVANGQIDKLLAHIQQIGFSNVDAWITFNKRMAPAQPLSPPQGVRAYALPGGTYRGSDSKVHDAQGNTGITWQVDHDERGYLRPSHPVMYHVWRDRQGNGTTPAPNAEARELVTKGRPLLLINPSEIASQRVQYPADWPPFALRCIDFSLAEGWYGYQVNAIDLFGRFSSKSGFTEWHQWNPPPQPKPWYYRDPPASPVVHPASVRILDKLAPPPPSAVEAYALDPADPLVVRDLAYRNWLLTLPPQAEPNKPVGLRVRWWWTVGQQRQSPDTTEFRIYWHPGSAMPADRHDVTAWQLRCFVCPYGQHVTVLSQDELATLEQNGQLVQVVSHRQNDRQYEVFLPIIGVAESFTNGAPLVPTLTDPVAYANVTVTAADAAIHSLDRWLGTGRLAGRVGNESQPAAPQRVYRVWRQQPTPPPALAEPGRHYATAADYHSRSFFTYQWQPTANLLVHVYRALDDSVFKADWAIRSQRGPLDLSRSEHQAYFPADWNAARRLAAATALNALNSQADYRSLPDDALRVLAGLPGNEKAFSQLTTAQLDSSVASLRDVLDGRATNRYFYRAIYVDKAQNRSALGLASAPVFLPNVTPPKAPVITKVVGGDREISLSWTSNREADLAEYRVYRADNAEAARDVRLMQQVATLPVNTTPAARPAAVQWTDTPVAGLRDFWYCLVAVDRVDPVDARGGGGNVSAPSMVARGRAQQPVPSAPTIDIPSWDSAHTAITVTWQSDDPFLTPRLERRQGEGEPWVIVVDWLPAGTQTTQDIPPDPSLVYEYRIRVRDHVGQSVFSELVATP